MNDSDRMLLQRIMAAGVMEDKEVRCLARKLTGENMTASDVIQMVNKVAENIRPFALDVRRGMYDDGKMYLAVVNTSNDALTAFGSNFKPWEIVFFRKVVEEIVDTEEGALEEATLYNLRKSPTTLNEVEELLRKLTAEKWIALSAVQLQTRSFTLGPRGFLELIAFLRDLQVKKCPICQYELLQGVKCQDRKCETIVHYSCVDKYEKSGVCYKCPICKHKLRRSPHCA
ncbi:non-structural maintenance of chromosomes element 1-like protein [Plasmopara halstedii]|uniref:Non-structural maintenance of chromosomes element 1 homolog n=1 Tax=Plasmopara halstedii TaxID=4781 RepID=A0A0P1AFP7_PLAHL|nr:non-structural maintenance of chromosomes element 1-like protein [Plasmopara halstedii]CEG39468.1 non-structural maintenance of chromosomes element 1-like protein [Plasmopara halstedii]|eukprot:XP_024575837.1 non-structural maintenance of chromosomes element 1-like protein [Plasmopara halstedii]